MNDLSELPERSTIPDLTSLTVVVPCYNEADNIEPCYTEIVTELADHDLEVLFVDDGSTDATLAIIRRLAEADPRVQYLSFTRNFGFEAAFSAGYRYASRPWTLHLDADQQFPAAEARKLIATAKSGYDAVFGVRTNRKDPRLRRWGTSAFHFIGRRLLNIELPEGATAFRLVRTPLARTVIDLELGTPYFINPGQRLTSRYTTISVGHRPRTRGSSKVGFGWLASHAIELFVGFTNRLVTIAAAAALLGALGALLLGIGAVTGLLGGTAATASGFALGALLLPVLALIVRYLVVINAGQPRPRRYYVRESTIVVRKEDLLFPATQPAASAEPGGQSGAATTLSIKGAGR